MENKNIYVGHRYVPKIIGVHDSTQAYEGLSIVTHEGTSYTSKKYVPEGISITNDEFWVVTGNYNAQVEHYRQEVVNLKNDLDSQINDINDDLSVTKDNVDSMLINVMFPPVPLVAVKGDGSDETQAIKNIFSNLKRGDTVFFPTPPNKYVMYDELIIEQHGIKVIGTSQYRGNGSIIEFVGCNGIVRSGSYIDIENISIEGTEKEESNTININNNIFGTIGLKNKYSTNQGIGTSGGGKTTNVSIYGFNVGYSSYPESSATWSGAYRENRDIYISNNDIGILALNGATHEKFFGGRLEGNTIHGIYADVKNEQYNNLEFIGMTIEKNGNISGSYNDPSWDNENYGIYSGNETDLKFNNCYFELVHIFTNHEGRIFINESHVHHNVRMFGKGVIRDHLSSAPYEVVFKWGGDFNEKFTFSNCTGKQLNPNHARMEITSESSGVIKADMEQISLRSTQAKNIKRVKVSFSMKVNSGKNAEGFGIMTSLKLSALEGSSDVMNRDITYPVQHFQPNKNVGEYEYFEFYYVPRFDGSYIDKNKILSNLTLSFIFSKNKESLFADYTNTPLDLEINNLTVTFLSDQDFK